MYTELKTSETQDLIAFLRNHTERHKLATAICWCAAL